VDVTGVFSFPVPFPSSALTHQMQIWETRAGLSFHFLNFSSAAPEEYISELNIRKYNINYVHYNAMNITVRPRNIYVRIRNFVKTRLYQNRYYNKVNAYNVFHFMTVSNIRGIMWLGPWFAKDLNATASLSCILCFMVEKM
jgi:hypothetical protein